ncbi:uncharacterized protein LOC131947531 [Physella acuta]|uniref:uncharacterized protein LOC131947531 n=1 Tax=Physella acuta TaxID=109671 RepID=UPI0027DD20A2|nr:uncharacterized protein LOC131947531 [Physella acuta]
MALPAGIKVGSLAAVVVLSVGVILHIGGLATPGWSVQDGWAKYGLWKVCDQSYCKEHSFKPAALEACEAMAIIGTWISFVAMAVAWIDIFHKILGKDAALPFHLISAAAAIISFVFILIGVIIWGAKLNNHLMKIGYSFILSIIGGILIATGGIIYGIFGRTSA